MPTGSVYRSNETESHGLTAVHATMAAVHVTMTAVHARMTRIASPQPLVPR